MFDDKQHIRISRRSIKFLVLGLLVLIYCLIEELHHLGGVRVLGVYEFKGFSLCAAIGVWIEFIVVVTQIVLEFHVFLDLLHSLAQDTHACCDCVVFH